MAYFEILVEMMRPMKNLDQFSCCPSHDSYQASPKFRSEELWHGPTSLAILNECAECCYKACVIGAGKNCGYRMKRD
jgi:hypothetical protein